MFAMYQGHGVDARLKTPIEEHKVAYANWQSEWDNLFYQPCSAEADFISSYHALQHQLSAELNVADNSN